MRKINLVIIGLFVGILSVKAQQVTQDDYKRAVSFMYENYNNKTAFNLNTPINWFENGSGIWFLNYTKEGKFYKTVSFHDFKVKILFNEAKLVQSLNTILDEKINENELIISNIERTSNGNLTFKYHEKMYSLNVKSYEVKSIKEDKKEPKNEFESLSPDGNWLAYTKNYNLFIKSTKTNEEYQLSFDGKKNYEYATYYGWFDIIEGENGERPKHFNVEWSKDSKWITADVIDYRNAEKMYLLDYSIDSLYKPKLLSYYRGSPGDTTMVHVQPVFYNVDTKKEIKTSLPRGTHINSASVQWQNKSGVVLAQYAERGFKKEYVKQIDLNSNTTKTLITEESETNVDNFTYQLLDKSQKIAFLSERSGWRQLYLLDLETNKITPLANGDYYVNSIAHIDEENETIYFLASGKENNSNPYHQKLYKVNFKGEIVLLTPEEMHHTVSFSKDGKYFSDNFSTINIPTTTVLRESKTGKILSKLTTANVDEALAIGWQAPEVFELKAKDEKTIIYGAIWKPTNLDSLKSYPIIDHTYTGPHTQVFPKSFDRAFMNQSLAELGFIVVMVDGLGTSNRSKEFHNHSYKNMENNLVDHVLAIKFLGQKYNWINVDKVGIFGHSAGGYDTGRALLGFPDFYKVGVASSGDHDFRMEKAWWPEMYQGFPIDSTYQKVSNVTNAKNLKGKLLLVHGGIDDNVNPSGTYKLAEALVNADKQFDLVILPSQRHGYQGNAKLYFTKVKWNYFVKYLLDAQPIWNFDWK